MKWLSRSHELESKIAAIDRSQAVIEFALDGTILTANERFLAAMGYRLDEITGKHHSIFVDPAEVASPSYRELWDSMRAGKFIAGEFRRFDKNGHEVWIGGAYNPILHASGKPYKVIKFATDVTGQVRARRHMSLLSLVADGTNNAVVITDAHGLIEYINRGFERMTGYTEAEVIGRKPGSFLQGKHTNPQTVQAIRNSLAARTPFDQEILNYNKAGEPYWIALSINPIFDQRGQLERFVSVQANITESKHKSVESAARMKAIESANAVMEWNADGQLERTNATAMKLLHLETDQSGQAMPHLRLGALLNADQDDRLRAEKSLSVELTLPGLAGEVHVSGTLQTLQDEEGEVRRFVMYASDVTARRKAVNEANELMVSVLSKISNVAGDIANISFQTSILSVNAAIEAAHAGDSGRGFAVVAQSVRELSGRAAGSTDQISTLVDETTQKIAGLKLAS